MNIASEHYLCDELLSCVRVLHRITFVSEGFQEEESQVSVIKNLCQIQWLDFKGGICLA